MGIDNQLLSGTACLGIITLVVAIDAKKPEDLQQLDLPSDLDDGRDSPSAMLINFVYRAVSVICH